MLTGPKLKILEQLAGSSTQEELVWINGFIAGLLANAAKQVPVNEEVTITQTSALLASNGSRKMTVVYGTETGNAKKLATELANKAKKRSLSVKLASLDQYRLTDITKEENLFVVISTQGDGEPPAAAVKFYDHIHRNGFRLDRLKYSVLALGDTSYPLFCKTGEDVDLQLQNLGGNRIIPIRKCDLDYEADAAAWFEEVLQSIGDAPVAGAPAVVKPAPEPALKSNKKIYTGSILTHVNLHDRGSAKKTWHIELETGEEVDYLPGDSVGIVPKNATAVVNTVIHSTGIDPGKILTHKDADHTVIDLLTNKLNIGFLHERIVKKYAAIVQQEIPETKMELVDLLRIYPVKDAEQMEEVIRVLPLQSPRIYTIASANSAHSGEVHLTVEKDVFTIEGTEKTGLCTDYLGSLGPGDSVEFFVQKNKRFKLPAADKDVLMIGPGTGIAPFRSFLAERDATGAAGKNWLFFGEDHFVSDFLYQTEIQNWYETGVLTKVNLAFAKDYPGGIGVHHKLLQHGKEVFNWMQSGAYLYVSGQKAPMSVEVENALITIIERYSGLPAKETMEYFDRLKEEGRYLKEVY